SSSRSSFRSVTVSLPLLTAVRRSAGLGRAGWGGGLVSRFGVGWGFGGWGWGGFWLGVRCVGGPLGGGGAGGFAGGGGRRGWVGGSLGAPGSWPGLGRETRA